MIDELPEDVQRRMMEKLLGKDNAQRLQGAKENGARFRYRRPIHTAEFFRVPANEWHPWETWTVNVFENGRVHLRKEGLTEEECTIVVKAIRAKGVPIKRLMLEADRHHVSTKCVATSQRKALLNSLKDFRL